MPTATVNGVKLFYELSGIGEIPLVFVHGAWVSHHGWDFVAPKLAKLFRVLTYDRRGHSESEPPTGEGSLREDVADLAALIQQLGLAPAWVVSNSSGGLVTLRLAGERPELFRGLIAHEPPLWSLIGDDPSLASQLAENRRKIDAVVERIVSGDHAGAAELFVEKVAFGPGTWKQLPPAFQQTFIRNAPTFLDEIRDPDIAGATGYRPELPPFDVASIKGFTRPLLLTKGDQSPPTFAPVVAKLAAALPNVEVLTFRGAGHVPQFTHPDSYVEAITAFIRKKTR